MMFNIVMDRELKNINELINKLENYIDDFVSLFDKADKNAHIHLSEKMIKKYGNYAEDVITNEIKKLTSKIQTSIDYLSTNLHFRIHEFPNWLTDGFIFEGIIINNVDGSNIIKPDILKNELTNLKKYITRISSLVKRNEVSKYTEKITPNIKLPKNTIWEDISIKFCNSTSADLYIKNEHLKKITPQDLLCNKSKKDISPTKEWKLLLILSFYNKEGGMNLNDYPKPDEKTLIKQQKRQLSKKLKSAFGITNDPFYEYSENDSYKTKFILEPAPMLRNAGEIWGFKDIERKFYKNEATNYLGDF